MPCDYDDRTSEAASEKNQYGEQLSCCDERVEARVLLVQEGGFRVVDERAKIKKMRIVCGTRRIIVCVTCLTSDWRGVLFLLVCQ